MIQSKRSVRGLTALLFTAVLWGNLLPAIAESTNQADETIIINANASVKPFPHFWEHMFGSGRAALSLRESYRRDLNSVRSITGFQYVRFHAIFHDELGLYDEDKDGKPIYNFSYIDQVYDGLLNNGVKPFVELSFMPNKLAGTPIYHSFWYKPDVAPPKDWQKWDDMMTKFAEHLIERYGIEEVSSWYFEVWNEPNLDFWGGKPSEETYYKLYDVTARALKKVSPKIRVGGPSTAQAAWVDRFIAHCTKETVPVDFVSTHVYGNDSAKDVFGTTENIPRSDMVARSVRKVYDQVKASVKPNLPIFWSEYNASYMNEPNVTDSSYMGPWLANNIRLCDGLANEMSYWCFSDVFEEQGVVKKPFYGGYGLVAAGNIPKPAFNAFKILHLLGDQKLNLDSSSAIATKRGDRATVIAVWNYAAPELAGVSKTVDIKLPDSKTPRTARIHLLDAHHGSSYTEWQAMNKPDFPSREQQQKLQQAAQLPSPVLQQITGSTLSLKLEPHALAVIEIIDAKM